jgi:hypothetical protein
MSDATLSHAVRVAEAIATNVQAHATAFTVVNVGMLPQIVAVVTEQTVAYDLEEIMPACAILCELAESPVQDPGASVYEQIYNVSIVALVPFDPLSHDAWKTAQNTCVPLADTFALHRFLVSDTPTSCTLCSSSGGDVVQVEFCQLGAGPRFTMLPRLDLKCAVLEVTGAVLLGPVPLIVPTA